MTRWTEFVDHDDRAFHELLTGTVPLLLGPAAPRVRRDRVAVGAGPDRTPANTHEAWGQRGRAAAHGSGVQSLPAPARLTPIRPTPFGRARQPRRRALGECALLRSRRAAELRGGRTMEHERTILDRLSERFPGEAIKHREGGGRSKLAYVETQTVIRRLNHAVASWDFAIKSMELHGDVWIVVGELTVPGLGTRAGIGVQRMSEKQRDKSEDLIKGAASDALKKAATLFGVALDLYGPDYEGTDTPPAPRGTASPPANPPDQLTPAALQQLMDAARARGVSWTRVRTRAEEQFDKATDATWTADEGRALSLWLKRALSDADLAEFDPLHAELDGEGASHA